VSPSGPIANWADRIVAEQNFSGDMVRAVIHSIERNVPVQLVAVSRGKAVRPEPVSALRRRNPTDNPAGQPSARPTRRPTPPSSLLRASARRNCSSPAGRAFKSIPDLNFLRGRCCHRYSSALPQSPNRAVEMQRAGLGFADHAMKIATRPADEITWLGLGYSLGAWCCHCCGRRIGDGISTRVFRRSAAAPR